MQAPTTYELVVNLKTEKAPKSHRTSLLAAPTN